MINNRSSLLYRLIGKAAAIILMMALTAPVMKAQKFPVNYDEDKVPAYVLEDPLVFQDGRNVKKKDWPQRRAEILDIFQKEMYGQLPPAPSKMVTETLEEGLIMAGHARRRQVRMWFRDDKTGPCITWLILTPEKLKGPFPVVLLLNYQGNHTVLPDEEILIPDI